MSNYLTDPELQRQFAEIRQKNERKLRLQQEQEERLRRQAAEASKQRAEEGRRQAAARFESDLRAAFFAANPAATEEDWRRLGPQIRDAHMRDAAAHGVVNVFDRIRSEAFRREQEELGRRSRFMQLSEGV